MKSNGNETEHDKIILCDRIKSHNRFVFLCVCVTNDGVGIIYIETVSSVIVFDQTLDDNSTITWY